MDVTYHWKRPDTDVAASLYKALCAAHDELQQGAFAKWGRAKRVSCDAYAHVENIELLATCSEWKPDAALDLKHTMKKPHEPAGVMGDIVVNRDRIMGAHVIRLVATFDVTSETDKTLYANVRLSDASLDE